ncbi:Predicted arabinose efflux permease, MFS family [Roseateles sp. YR242]|uniref:MFS transporter n=1 Tax=Roseateles sp. YR242 TaxID=1855305 RepID=UPI0008B2C209|nr:MFS transporter [Roseateles sp. YR242]SEK56319.1 Predicted arabinose efflux permease, MFS family [Roseateles sp. YR242]
MAAPTVSPPGPLIVLMAASAGLGAASLYYSQPILAALADDLHASPAQIGAVPMLTQLGYAAGILLLTPLGDRFDRRKVILTKFVLLVLTLLLCGLVPAYTPFLLASALLGLTATLAQDVVPMAAALSPMEHRGRIVGQVMTGLLLGILLSRVMSGIVAEVLGWRWVFGLAALALSITGLVSWRWLPSLKPAAPTTYPALMRSLGKLWRELPALRRATLAQGMLSLAFSAFWSTLAVMLHQRFGLGSAVSGAFGLAGAAGALAAPLAGRIADKRGPGVVTQVGALITAVSFAVMSVTPLLDRSAALVLLVVLAIAFDFGVQAVLVSHQTIVFGLDPAARSRLNAILFTGMFIGMATGAALGSVLLNHVGWVGVTGLATFTSLITLVLRLKAEKA